MHGLIGISLEFPEINAYPYAILLHPHLDTANHLLRKG